MSDVMCQKNIYKVVKLAGGGSFINGATPFSFFKQDTLLHRSSFKIFANIYNTIFGKFFLQTLRVECKKDIFIARTAAANYWVDHSAS